MRGEREIRSRQIDACNSQHRHGRPKSRMSRQKSWVDCWDRDQRAWCRQGFDATRLAWDGVPSSCGSISPDEVRKHMLRCVSVLTRRRTV